MSRREIVRSFVCIELPGDIKRDVSGFISQIRGLDMGVKWVEEHNLHITLRFLGEEPITKVEKMKNSLVKAIPALRLSPFKLSLKGIGVFPDWNRPRVIWVGLEGEGLSKLRLLRDTIEAEARRLDFVKDDKSFSPHITLGRAKTGRISSELKAYLEGRSDLSFGEFLVRDLILMRSQLFPSGPIYTPLATFVLEGG